MTYDIIFYLLRRGAHREPVRITTGEIAQAVGISQQTASRKLISLEKEGKVAREGSGILLTQKAISEIELFVREILQSLEKGGLNFRGKVVPGFGEGAYFMSLNGYSAQFKRKLGFEAFRGTLNVEMDDNQIEKRVTLRERKPIKIDGFSLGKKEFGPIDAYRCVIDGTPGALIFPKMSHHGLRVLEIVSPFNLRKKLGLSDGSVVRVETV